MRAGVAEQVNSKGGPDEHAKHAQVGGGKFLNLHALRLNLEPSGGI